ncbi:MAG TPA: hypothetical protein VGG41_08030 [Solirubrobacteraceae bacterium]|jgi:hypothetical protein
MVDASNASNTVCAGCGKEIGGDEIVLAEFDDRRFQIIRPQDLDDTSQPARFWHSGCVVVGA